MGMDSLIAAIPDFVAFVRRDGTILHHVGGRSVGEASTSGELTGRRLDEIWTGPDAELLVQWVRKSLASRSLVEARLQHDNHGFDVRISAEGPDRALCVIRHASVAPVSGSERGEAGDGAPVAADRRGFVTRLQQSVADAVLRERPLCVGMILLEGLAQIGQAIDYAISDKVTTAALRRLPVPEPGQDPAQLSWYVGQLGETLLAVVIEGAGVREMARGVAQSLAASLAEPVRVGDATFTLAPSVGVAQLGRDATRPQALLECARAAMIEARRSGAAEVQFYSDTLSLRPMVRLDLERELRVALDDDEMRLRYLGRHDLETGKMESIQATLRWIAPLRGEVPPAQFLPIAENTGLALQLSQWALRRLDRDWPTLRQLAGEQLRISFAALRHHLAADTLAQDIESLASNGGIDPRMLELRISEKSLAALAEPERSLRRLAGLGATIVIDEFGRGSTSLAQLGQLPIDALQIDRSFVLAAATDAAAASVCRGVAGLARGFGLKTYAAGIDDEAHCRAMLQIGCTHGMGDYYGSLPAIDHAPRRRRLAG